MNRNDTIKGFSCLDYKEAAQKELQKETKGMTWKEEVEFYGKKAMEGPLSSLVKRLKNKPKPIMAQESPATYKSRSQKRK